MALQETTDSTAVSGLRRQAISLEAKAERRTWVPATMFGYAVIFSFFGIFGVWAATAPLGSGVIASGTLKVHAGRQVVQHADGGTITDILVREGEYVEKGQVLFRLDPLEPGAEQRLIRNRLYSLLSERSRVVAERDSLDDIAVDEVAERYVSDPDFQQILDNERKLFLTRKDSTSRQLQIRREQIEQLRTEVSALEVREAAVRQQLSFIEEELDGVMQLFKKGQVVKTRLLALQRAQAGLNGDIGTIIAQRARAGQQIHQQELIIEAMMQDIVSRSVERLRTIDLELTQVGEQLALSDARIDRIEIRSPRSGRVSTLHVSTIGAIIGRGTALMEIIPEDDKLIVEGKVKPRDIDSVKRGATVEVRISAFNARTTPPVAGYVIAIAPDTTTPAGRGKPYYEVVIELDEEDIERSLGDKYLVSGMPVNAIIAVGERTLLEYWVAPLTSSFQQAMREP